MRASVVEHRSPACGWRRNTESEKTHGGFGKDCPCHADCGLHDYRLNNVWKNVADDDAQVAGAERAGGLDEFALARGKNLSADKASVTDPPAEREREDQIENARAAESDEGNGEKNSGEGEECVHEDDIDEAVDASAIIAGDRTDDEPEGKRGENDATAHQHRDASA